VVSLPLVVVPVTALAFDMAAKPQQLAEFLEFIADER